MAVGIEQDKHITYLPMHLFWEGHGQLGVRGEGGVVVVGVGGFQLMIERIEQL
jgi:hypothetical protein